MRHFVVNTLILTLFLTIILLSCKKDDELDETMPCSSPEETFECKSTPYTLTQLPYFPLYPKRITEIEFTTERIALGRKLFYETKLSGNNTMSCATCHNQQFAFTDNGNQFSDGIDGTFGTKNSMALFNLGYNPAFFWDGRIPTLEKQAIEPVMDPIEMHDTWKNAIVKLKGEKEYRQMFYEAFCTANFDSTHAADAITQFELILLSGNSEYDKAVARINGDTKIQPQFTSQEVARGYRVFTSEVSSNGGGGDCFHCHSIDNMLFTNNKFMNNGLDENPEEGFYVVTRNERNWGQFRVPTLRNLKYTAPYMHDGRFETLQKVVDFYNSGVITNSRNIEPILVSGDPKGGSGIGIANGLNLTDQQKKDLVAFLEALSDPDFVINPEYSDPN